MNHLFLPVLKLNAPQLINMSLSLLMISLLNYNKRIHTMLVLMYCFAAR
jgi:hypothetical protein